MMEIRTGLFFLMLLEMLLCGWVLGYMTALWVRKRARRILEEILPDVDGGPDG